MNSKLMNKLAIMLVLSSTLIFNACKKDEETTVITPDTKGVIVVNEGGYGKSNGSVGIYKLGTSSYSEVFKSANGRPLGDVVQSITEIEGKYYIVVNNSNKIEVVNVSDFKSVATISVTQPRNVLKVSETKAYISQFDNNMSILDLTTNTITGNINVKTSTDNMALMNNKVYVCKAYSDKLFVINGTDNMVVDSLTVGTGLANVVNVGTTKLALFCLGAVDFNTGAVTENGKIVFVNQDSVKIERTFALTTGSYGGSMINYNSNLYFTFGDKKLYRISSLATSGLPTEVLTASGNIYGFNINKNGEIYTTDAGDYASEGKVYIYNANGVKQKEFTAGIVPSKIIFNY